MINMLRAQMKKVNNMPRTDRSCKQREKNAMKESKGNAGDQKHHNRNGNCLE